MKPQIQKFKSKVNLKMGVFIVLIFLIFNAKAQNHSTLTIYFQTGSAEITEDDQLQIKNFIEQIRSENQILGIWIVTFCDDVGNEKYNTQLSNKRANALTLQLSKLIQLENIKFKKSSKGQLPIDTLKNVEVDKQRYRNRRGSIRVFYKENKVSYESLKKGEKIILDNVLFRGGTSYLLSESYPSLKKLLMIMQKKANWKIEIIGHVWNNSDEDAIDVVTGKKNLSVKRAQRVYSYLIDNGIETQRLSYKGVGGKFPTGKRPKYDRRVEVKLIEN